MMETHLLYIVYEIFGIPNIEFPIMMDLLCNGDPYIVYLVYHTTILRNEWDFYETPLSYIVLESSGC